ncbi:IclR family transcriptional regulator [Peribacillus frigoritolerans]|uniref:IclR family transcriptional regulator n=1 Tax=Peribacillus frigoritolerans TaxID=450367 RepID=UPI002281E76C|nr:IclR family transcriptional regulator C-terminal domain-containing protein [Peribacillus frigoritolerans]MCY9002458.1 hypothetical protein [Peribacillus frigoritolerans]
MELIRISSIISGKIDLKEIARPYLEELVLKHRETVCLVLYYKEKRRIMWVDKVNGPEPLQYVISMGELQPVPFGSSGKSILAFLEQSEIEQICKEEGFTSNKIQDLLRELQMIRERRISTTISERLPGSKGFASPILNTIGEPIGSIVFSAPISRVDPEKESEISEDIKNSAIKISEILGSKH